MCTVCPAKLFCILSVYSIQESVDFCVTPVHTRGWYRNPVYLVREYTGWHRCAHNSCKTFLYTFCILDTEVCRFLCAPCHTQSWYTTFQSDNAEIPLLVHTRTRTRTRRHTRTRVHLYVHIRTYVHTRSYTALIPLIIYSVKSYAWPACDLAQRWSNADTQTKVLQMTELLLFYN